MALRGSSAQVNTAAATSVVVSVTGISPQLNDIIILALSGGGGNGHAETVTFPTGFTSIAGLSNYYMPGAGSTLAVAYKIGTGSEPTSYTIGYGISDFLTAQCWAFSGRNTGSPFSTVASSTEASLSASPSTLALTGLTAVAADDVLEFVGLGYNATGSATASLAAPAGYTNARTDISTTTGFAQVAAGCTLINSAGGATGTNGGVLTWTNLFSSYASFQMAIAKAPAATTLFRKTLSGIGGRIGSRQLQS